LACEHLVHLPKFVNGVATRIILESLHVIFEGARIKCRQASPKLNGSQVLREASATHFDKTANIVLSESVGGKCLGVLFSCSLEFGGQ
jgi:hypothetical protein